MRIKQLLLLATSFTCAQTACSEPLQSISFFSPRSQTTNAAQELIEDQMFIYQQEIKPSHLFMTTVGYYQSLHPNQLAIMLFDTDSLVLEGSFLENREEDALLADYFGLSPSFEGVVDIDPEWKSVYMPFTFYFDLSRWVCGMYLRVCAPFVWNKSTLELTQTATNNGSDTPFPPEYMSVNELPAPYTTFPQALKSGQQYGFVQPLLFGKYKECQTTQRLANSTFDIGWNVLLDDDRHFGLKIRVVTPNGTRPTSEYIFEPLAGNRRQWELGFGLNGHTRIWCDDDQELSVYLNFLMTHLFNGKQRRSFDIKGICNRQRFLSRYMLVKEFDEAGAFTGTVSPLINHTTLNCEVNVAVQFDGAFMFSYNYKQLTFDVGYNGWIRSKENITLCNTIPDKRYGLKGIQDVIDEGGLSQITQSTASIFGNNFADQSLVADLDSPRFLYSSDIDLTSARSPLVFSHKLFTYIGYTGGKLHKMRSVQPCIGIGSEIEFQGINTNNDDIYQMDQLTLSQWSVFLKAGVLFG